jgi:hypothetical protein
MQFSEKLKANFGSALARGFSLWRPNFVSVYVRGRFSRDAVEIRMPLAMEH